MRGQGRSLFLGDWGGEKSKSVYLFYHVCTVSIIYVYGSHSVYCVRLTGLKYHVHGVFFGLGRRVIYWDFGEEHVCKMYIQ